MHRLVRDFVGRTYHIVGNLKARLMPIDQVEPISGPTNDMFGPQSKLLVTEGLPESILKKLILKKNQQTTKRHEKLPSFQHMRI